MLSGRLLVFLGLWWLGILGAFLAGFGFHAYLGRPMPGMSTIAQQATAIRAERDKQVAPEAWAQLLREKNERQWFDQRSYVETLEVTEIAINKTLVEDFWTVSIADPTGKRTTFWTTGPVVGLGIPMPVRTITAY